MNRLLIIKASWKQLFESVFATFSILFISYIVIRFVLSGIFVYFGTSLFKYESSSFVIFAISVMMYLIAYYRGISGTRDLMSDIVFNRIKQIDAEFLESISTKISVTRINRNTLKINNKAYLHLYSGTPLNISSGTKVNLQYAEKSLIIVNYKIL